MQNVLKWEQGKRGGMPARVIRQKRPKTPPQAPPGVPAVAARGFSNFTAAHRFTGLIRDFDAFLQQ
jgi:hypothetical protein